MNVNVTSYLVHTFIDCCSVFAAIVETQRRVQDHEFNLGPHRFIDCSLLIVFAVVIEAQRRDQESNVTLDLICSLIV